MTSVLTHNQRRSRGGEVVGAFLCVVAMLVAVVGTGAATRTPGHRRVTVINPFRWKAVVDVGQVGIGTVGRDRAATFDEVLDQGDGWTFRFSYAGVDGGRTTLSREELERQRWRIVVPDLFAQQMQVHRIPASG